MDDVRINQIRSAEAFSHTEAYAKHVLFEPGSWLSKPVKTVMDLVPYFLHLQHFAGLDLGCGVGRNCIPFLQKMQNIPCRMDCVDILEFAIKQLRENAAKYHVETSVHGIVCPVDSYQIKGNSYDLILGISVLEHLDSVESLTEKLYQIRNGLHINGIACFVINTSIKEHHKATKIPLPVQFEINLQTDRMVAILDEVFLGYEILKQSVIHYTYDTFRENGIVELHTDVLTYVVRRRR